MKKLLGLLLVLSVIFFSSCDSEDDPITPPIDETGDIFITSVPAGAQIWVNGTNSGKVTPDSVTDLDAEDYNITLKLEGYYDTTFTVSVTANQVATRNINLVSALTFYSSVRIFETLGTSVDEPSGLDLSSGNAYGVSGADKMDVDIYYSSNGFLVQSAHLNVTNGLTRETKFRVGTGTDLNDGTNSPLVTSGTWTDNIGDRENNYVFLYDDDGHYSKIKITAFGGGTPGNPAWVELSWWYNEITDNVAF